MCERKINNNLFIVIKKLSSDFLIYSIGPQIPKISSFFILPLITPFLSTTDYGVSGVVMAYTGLLASLGDLGFSLLMMNSFYNYRQKWGHYWGQYHFYLIMWSFFYSILLGILLFFVIPEEASGNKIMIIALFVIPSLFFNVTVMMATKFYQYSGKPIYVSLVSALVGVIAVFLNLYTVAYLKLGYMGWFISSFFSGLLSCIFYIYPVYFKYKIYPICVFRIKFLLKSLKVSLLSIPHNYSSYLLNSSDRLVMDRLGLKTSSIGEYNIANIFGGYMEFFGSAMGLAIGPILTKAFSQKNKESGKKIKDLINFLQILFVVVGFVFSLWCKELFYLLVKNESLNKMYPLAIIIIMGYTYKPYYWLATTRLQYSENLKAIVRITFIAGILNVVLNIIFIPFFGIVAAALTTFICLLWSGFAGYFLKSFRNVECESYSPIMSIVIIIIASVTVFTLKDSFWLIKLFITMCLCAFTYIRYLMIEKNLNKTL